MSESQKKTEPKKLKMPPLVDRSEWYDTMSWVDDSLETTTNYENHPENDSQGLSELESQQTG